MENEKTIQSTYLTGGGGFSYEDKIGAYYLSILLKKSLPCGLENAEMTKILFQQANQGNPLDDFEIEASRNGQKITLSLQAKSHISFGENKKFARVIKDCFSLLKEDDFNIDIDKFGIIVGTFNNNIEQHYKKLNLLANNVSNAEEFATLIENQSKTTKSFYSKIKAILKDLLEDETEELWCFFKSFVILHLYDSTPSKSEQETIDNLRGILQNHQDSQNAYNALLKIASKARIAGGSIDYNSLISKLVNEGIFTIPDNSLKNDYLKILKYNKNALSFIKQDINGQIVDRTSLLEEVKANIEKSDLTNLFGTEGVGKSALIKIIAEEYIQNSNVIFFSDKSLNFFQDGGWQGLSNYLNLDNSLEDILYSLVANGKNILIFIDGIDFISVESKQSIIKELITEFNKIKSDINFNFKVITTARTSSNSDWVQNIGQSYKIHNQDIQFELSKNKDFLKQLNLDIKFFEIENERLNPLFSNLFILEIFANISNKQKISNEWGIAKLWWNEQIKDAEIKNVLLNKLAVELLKSPNYKHSVTDSTNSLDKLINEAILVKDDYEKYSTRHDIYRDWLFSFLFDSEFLNSTEELNTTIDGLDTLYSNYYLKGFALFSSRLLIEENYNAWLDLYEVLKEKENPIWKQAMLESILNLSTDSITLFKFLNSIVSNKSLLENLLNYLYSSTIRTTEKHQLYVDFWKWQPFISWLSIKATEVDLYEETHKLFSLWRYNLLLVGDFHFSQITDIYKYWLDKSRGERGWKYKEDEILRELIYLSKYKPEYIKYELKSRFKHHSEVDVFLEDNPATILIDKFPEEYSNFIFDNTTFSIEELKERQQEPFYSCPGFGNEDLYLFEGHILDKYSSCLSPYLKVFSYFIEKEEDIAIDLIQRLSNRALDGLTFHNELKEENIIEVQIDSGSYEFYGDGLVYLWFRPHYKVPALLNLAFISIENWLRNEVKNGRDFKELILKLLKQNANNPLSIIGLALSVGLEFYEQTKDVLFELATDVHFWGFDLNRYCADKQNYIGAYGFHILPKYIDKANENNNLEHRKLSIREYLLFLFQDEAYYDIAIKKVKKWNIKDKQIKTYQLQAFQYAEIAKGNNKKAEEYQRKIEDLNKEDNERSNLPIWYIQLAHSKDESIKITPEENYIEIFDKIKSTYKQIEHNSMSLSSLLEFLLKVFIHKYEWLKSSKNLKFCTQIIKDILAKDQRDLDPIYINSILSYISGILAVKIYNEYPKHNKNDYSMILEILASSAFNSGRCGQEYPNKVIWKVLNKLTLEKSNIDFYTTLLNSSRDIFTEKRILVRTRHSEESQKQLNKKLNIKLKKYSEITKQSICSFDEDISNISIFEDYFASLNFTSSNFTFFEENDLDFKENYLTTLNWILDKYIFLSEDNFEDRGHPNEYKGWYTAVPKLIFNIKRQYGVEIYFKFIDKIINKKKYIPYLLEYLVHEYFHEDVINDKNYVDNLKLIYLKLLNSEKVTDSSRNSYISDILFCSYGIKILEDSWEFHDDFINIYNQWITIYGADSSFYSTFLYFIKSYHSNFKLNKIISWFDEVMKSPNVSYQRLFEYNGAMTLSVLEELIEIYPEVLTEKSLKPIIVDIVNKLIDCNIEQATKLQQVIY